MVWRTWFECYGRARIEPVNSRDDVADYCAKYGAKERSWWDGKFLGQRHPALPSRPATCSAVARPVPQCRPTGRMRNMFHWCAATGTEVCFDRIEPAYERYTNGGRTSAI